MRRYHKIVIAIVIVASFQNCNNWLLAQTKPRQSLFFLYDSLDRMYNGDHINIDRMYGLSKVVKLQADRFPDRNNIELAAIYMRCADCFRTHCDNYCGANDAPILCCKDSLAIVNCYLQSIEIFFGVGDSSSAGYLDAIYQLGDVYEELRRPQAALPLRKKLLQTTIREKGYYSEQTADAYMFMGGTYERLKFIYKADECYKNEIRIREHNKDRNLNGVKDRMARFRKKYHLD
jgi:hypothetical protein